MTTHHFYANLPLLKERGEIILFDRYRELPDDWCVVVTDIQGSTSAVSEGRYKDINLIGAACITSCLNACRGLKIPYVFGGDGATLLIPLAYLDAVKSSLSQLILLAETKFKFNLRVGIIPYGDIKQAEHSILVARLGTSSMVDQCILRGTGVSEAERLTKKEGSQFLLQKPSVQGDPLLEGLECRWQPVASQAGRFLSLLVATLSEDPTEKQRTMTRVLNIIAEVQQKKIPVQSKNLKLTLNPFKLLSEAKLRSPSPSLKKLWRYLFEAYVRTVVGWISGRFKITIGGYSGAKYQQEVTENTDAFKYDEVIRMVIDLSPAQEARLQDNLESLRVQGLIAYGLHFSTTALLTCMVFDRDSNHVHLIDGNDGGYTAASKQLKTQLKTVKKA
ncbi:MAG: DUF3095 domain-containing protein [Bdellovibrionales bacterium]|nr:DUF3095 domain-containing protein [Bdellovibrionales bacterium]